RHAWPRLLHVPHVNCGCLAAAGARPRRHLVFPQAGRRCVSRLFAAPPLRGADASQHATVRRYADLQVQPYPTGIRLLMKETHLMFKRLMTASAMVAVVLPAGALADTQITAVGSTAP